MFDVIWNGRDELTDTLDRDYADMCGDGWDLIWVPTSPLTTDWRDMAPYAQPDAEQHVRPFGRKRKGPPRGAPRILKDWQKEFTGEIAQRGSGHR